VGFDLLCLKKGKQRHVEVKGIGGSVPSFVLTEGELWRAGSDPFFWLYAVTNALDCPEACPMSGEELLKRYDFVPLAYHAVPLR
jgi:hypothetical protein